MKMCVEFFNYLFWTTEANLTLNKNEKKYCNSHQSVPTNIA